MPFFYGINPTYWLFMIPGLIFTLWAQWKVKSSYDKWKKVPNSRNITGAQAARYLLDSQGLQNVRIEEAQGFLSDHYDPSQKVLRLSSENFRQPSIASVGISAHEMGHALQDAQGYAPLVMRSRLVPVANIGSSLGVWIMLGGILMHWQPIAIAGLALFGLAFLFTIITLPVEFDASNRALKLIEKNSLLSASEMAGARDVLNSAAWTYVAAAAAALLQVLYWGMMIFGGGSRRR